LSLREVCDVVYALQVDRLERETLALIVGGATVDGKPLSLTEVRASFDASLTAIPAAGPDGDELALRRALGVA
jgi:hypothetical protein